MDSLANQVNLVRNDLVALARSPPIASLEPGVRDMFLRFRKSCRSAAADLIALKLTFGR
jgi:hypothetical protein